MNKFAFYSIKPNLYHPERSERSPEFGLNSVNLSSFTAFRMTYLGSSPDYAFSVRSVQTTWTPTNCALLLAVAVMLLVDVRMICVLLISALLAANK
jgi:hypothetical protein